MAHAWFYSCRNAQRWIYPYIDYDNSRRSGQRYTTVGSHLQAGKQYDIFCADTLIRATTLIKRRLQQPQQHRTFHGCDVCHASARASVWQTSAAVTRVHYPSSQNVSPQCAASERACHLSQLQWLSTISFSYWYRPSNPPQMRPISPVRSLANTQTLSSLSTSLSHLSGTLSPVVSPPIRCLCLCLI